MAIPSAYPSPAPQPRAFVLLNDEPVSDGGQDLLGAHRAAAQLSGLLLASRASTPFTLAVDAGWGMGKSSLMRLVDARLRRGPHVHTVWYNAWSSTGPDVLEGLIKSVLAQVDRSTLRRWVRRLRGGGAATAFLRALTVLAAGPLGVAGMVDELWRRLSVDAGARNAMRDALRDLVGEWSRGVGPADPRRLLVVFVDDLDRCGEQTFLAVCEAVKVYLDLPGLAFVIGCDRAALGPSGLLKDLSPAGLAFVEKIFQTSYRVPVPGHPDITAYVRACARQAGIDHLLDENLVDVLAQRAGRNPRRVKRLLNGLLLEASLNPIWADAAPDAVIRTVLLQYLYPDFFSMMTVPAGPGDGDVVREFRVYRALRGHWLLGRSWPERYGPAEAVLRPYGVRPAAGPHDRARALSDLEHRLPVGFPRLADDRAFVSLLEELVALPQSEVVLRRLREGLDVRSPLAYADDPPWPGDPYPSALYPLGGRPEDDPRRPGGGYGGPPPGTGAAGPADEAGEDAGPAAPAEEYAPSARDGRPGRVGPPRTARDLRIERMARGGQPVPGEEDGEPAEAARGTHVLPTPPGFHLSRTPSGIATQVLDVFGTLRDPEREGVLYPGPPPEAGPRRTACVAVAGLAGSPWAVDRALHAAGARAWFCGDLSAVLGAFRAPRPPDALLCDDSGPLSGVGLPLLGTLRSNGFTGPAAFLTPRITPALLRRAAAVDALATGDLAAGLRHLAGALDGAALTGPARYGAPTAPPARPSDGRRP